MNNDRTPGGTALEVVQRFAVALDQEDYAAARGTLDEGCSYLIRGQVHHGPDRIVESYQGNGEAAQRFDEIRYGSAVRPGEEGWVIITFSDHIRHRGEALDHYCEQWLRVSEENRIIRIEHHDLPGQREQLDAFKARWGFL